MWTTREKGTTGEDIACKWLENHGFLVTERNYLRKWGEIDIIASKDKILHFIEVKSVTKDPNSFRKHRPEENVHELKVRRLRRTIQTFLLERHYGLDADFKFHILTVEMNISTRRAHVNFLENIVL
jgi:putative endonuclease